MEHYIYKLTAPNGKVYIGRTKDWKERLKDHKHCAYTKKLNRHVYKSIRKYGWENFKKEIIAIVPDENAAIVCEEALILKLDSVKKGLNESYIGTDGGNQLTNPEVKERHRIAMSKASSGKNNPMYGRKQSAEARQKQKEKAKGRFSLPWYIDRYGKEEGTRLYVARGENRRQNMLQRYVKVS